MARVQRGNVILRVSDDEVQRYLNMGYDLTTPTGKVIQSAIPNDLGTLQTAYIDHTARIAELEAEIARLTAELSAERAKKPKTTAPKKPATKK